MSFLPSLVAPSPCYPAYLVLAKHPAHQILRNRDNLRVAVIVYDNEAKSILMPK